MYRWIVELNWDQSTVLLYRHFIASWCQATKLKWVKDFHWGHFVASIGNYKAFWAGVVTITDTIFYYIYIYTVRVWRYLWRVWGQWWNVKCLKFLVECVNLCSLRCFTASCGAHDGVHAGSHDAAATTTQMSIHRILLFFLAELSCFTLVHTKIHLFSVIPVGGTINWIIIKYNICNWFYLKKPTFIAFFLTHCRNIWFLPT